MPNIFDSEFDPYDCLIQLGKNQEFLYNREIIHTREIERLKGEINLLNRNIDDMADYIDAMKVIMDRLCLDMAYLKAMNKDEPKSPHNHPYLDDKTK